MEKITEISKLICYMRVDDYDEGIGMTLIAPEGHTALLNGKVVQFVEVQLKETPNRIFVTTEDGTEEITLDSNIDFKIGKVN